MITPEERKGLISAGIFVLLLLILVLILRIDNKSNTSNDLFYRKYVDRLEQENKKVQKRIDSLSYLLKVNQQILEELSEKKDQLKLVYVSKDKKIDTLTANGIVNEFNLFFTKISEK